MQYQKVRDQIDIFKRLRTRLKYDIKVRGQIYSLPYFLFYFIFSSHNFKLYICSKKIYDIFLTFRY